ncbi:MAG: Lrp/AsnC family transcriptional regulator [Nocardioidaceae bacterium]
MVVQAYILIQTDVGKAAEVAGEIAQVKGVTLAEDVTGPYDAALSAAPSSNADEVAVLVAWPGPTWSAVTCC